MPLFRKGPSPHRTALAMIGARAGDRVLVVGADGAKLAAELARVTGLNGRTLVVDRSADARARVEAAAGKAGTLVEFEPSSATSLPLDGEGFDIVVVHNQLADERTDRQDVLAEARRVLRDRARLITIEGGTQSGILGGLWRTPARVSGDALIELLTSVGLRAARVLAESEGTVYVEARK